MSSQTMSEALAPAIAYQKEQVMQETWGHLAPKKNKTYRGTILVAVGCYDPLNPTILDCQFKELNDSPWFYEAMQEYLWKQTFEPGVYRFTGKFKNYIFEGSIRELNII